jgi:hypothetical protein
LAGPSSGGDLAKAEPGNLARAHQTHAMKTLATQLSDAQDALDRSAREAQRRLAASVERSLERCGDPIGPLFQRAHRAIHTAVSAIETARRRMQADLASAADALLVEALVLAAVRHVEGTTRFELPVREETNGEEQVQHERPQHSRGE